MEVQGEMHFEESDVDDDKKRLTPDTDWSQQKLIYMQMFRSHNEWLLWKLNFMIFCRIHRKKTQPLQSRNIL